MIDYGATKRKSHENVSSFVPNGYSGNAKDDGEYECGGKKEEYGGVGGVDEEEQGQLCRPRRACWKDKAGVGERCDRYEERNWWLLNRTGRIARGGCSPLCRQSAFDHAKGYSGGDGDNANAGKVIL